MMANHTPGLFGFVAAGTLRARRSIKWRKISSAERPLKESPRVAKASRSTRERFACGQPSSLSASAISSAAATSSDRKLTATIRYLLRPGDLIAAFH